MAEQEPKSQRTEQPTARRLKKAREDGKVPRSPDVGTALSLAVFLLYCRVFGGDWLQRIQAVLAEAFSSLHRVELSRTELVRELASAETAALQLLAAPLGLIAFAAVGGNVLQHPPVFTLKPMQFDPSRLNPFQGIKKVVALSRWAELLKAGLKTVLYGAAALTAVRDTVRDGFATAPGPGGTLSAIFELASVVVFRVVLVALALALLDALFKRWDHVRGLRMSKKEIRDERKETEGDPTIRARLRSKQMALSRSRMMADVENATVVVTNPTHYAVALRYEPAGGDEVPRVLAKGRGKIAERIREVARRHRVPIVSDPPLARALYSGVQVGDVIPLALYRAVAELLALVLRRRRPAGSEVRP